MSTVAFDEQQTLSRGLAWGIVFGVTLLSAAPTLLIGRSIVTAAAADGTFMLLTGLGITLLGCLAVTLFVAWLFLRGRLHSWVDEAGVHLQYHPVHRSVCSFEHKDIVRAYARQSRPIGEYGGWGIRSGSGASGRAYTVTCSYGLQLELRDGTKVFIGSPRAEEFAAAVQPFLSAEDEA